MRPKYPLIDPSPLGLYSESDVESVDSSSDSTSTDLSDSSSDSSSKRRSSKKKKSHLNSDSSSSDSEFDRSDSGHKKSKKKKKKSKKSGMAKRASDKVKNPQIWPHSKLQYEFVSENKKQLTRGDLRLENNVLTVNFKWSKTCQFGHSRYIPLTAIPDSCLCPVKAYANVLSTINCSNYDSAFCYYNSRSQTVPILYSQFQRRLRELICLTGRDGNSFSSHSFRRGGCSLAFRSNVESELIQYHGDWLSSVYTEYLTYDYDQKLSVSRRMVNRILHDS